MIPYQSQMVTATLYVLSFLFLSLILITGLHCYRFSRANKRLSLLRPIFIELMRGKTDQIATTIQVPNLVGEIMNVDVPLHRIERERRTMVKAGEHNHLMWLSVLVCATYEDVMSFKDEMVEVMKKDMASLGLHEDAERLPALCKYPISAYMLFRIIVCMLDEMKSIPQHNSFLAEIRENAARYTISHDVTTIGRFKRIRTSIKYIGIVLGGVLISVVLFFFAAVLPESLVGLLLLVVFAVILFTLRLTVHIIQLIVKSLSCKKIEADIMADIPDFKIRRG